MTTSGTITMTMREVDRLRTIQAVVDGLLMTWQAAERLHLSRRQVERLTVASIPGRPDSKRCHKSRYAASRRRTAA